MTGLKKDISLRTENERSVIRTFASSIPAVNFSLRLKHFVKIFRIFLDRSLSAASRKTKLSRVKYLQFSMPTAEKWFASYGLLDAVFRYTENTDYRSFHSHVIQNAISDCCEAWDGYFESRKMRPAIQGSRGSRDTGNPGERAPLSFQTWPAALRTGDCSFLTLLLKQGRKGCVTALMFQGSRMLQRQDADQKRNSSRCGQSRTLDHTRSRSSRMTASGKMTCSRGKEISSVLTGTLPAS